MKAFFKWFFLLVGMLLLALVATAGAVYFGWIPVPDWAVNIVASSQGLDDKQARSLTRVVNVYQVVKTAPESKLLDQALKMATQGSDEAAWSNFAREAWPRISTETKNRVRDQLQIEAADFESLDALVTRVASASSGATLTAADQKLLQGLDVKYGVSDLIEQLRKGKK